MSGKEVFLLLVVFCIFLFLAVELLVRILWNNYLISLGQ